MANPIQAGSNAELKKAKGAASFAAGTIYVTGCA